MIFHCFTTFFLSASRTLKSKKITCLSILSQESAKVDVLTGVLTTFSTSHSATG